MVKKVLVTGAAGFIGRALIERLEQEAVDLCFAVRKVANTPEQAPTIKPIVFQGDIEPETDWAAALKDVDVVVHLAARAHILNDTVADPHAEFMRINYAATANLAEQCVEAGVSRFIFLSSIGVSVNNSSTEAISENSRCENIEAYAKSKLLAEDKLEEICSRAGMDLIIIRPPLVYGEMAPGNFGRLLKLAQSALPLPLGLATNKRNFIARSNLADFIAHCVVFKDSINEVFVVADNEVISTKDMIVFLRQGMGSSPKLIPIPAFMVRFLATILRRPQLYEQLFCDLKVDNTKAKTIIGWTPPYGAPDELKKCGAKSNMKIPGWK